MSDPDVQLRHGLPAGFELRRPRAGDLEEVAALAAAAAVAPASTPDLTPADVRTQWRRPGFDRERDAWLVLDARGAPAAFAAVRARVVQNEVRGSYLVAPRQRSEALEGFLLATVQARAGEIAAELGPGLPETAGMHFALRCDRRDRERRRLCAAHGMTPAHAFQHMAADIPRPPAAPDWPPGLVVRTLRRDRDERAVHAALREVFAQRVHEDPGPFDYWQRHVFALPGLDLALWFVAWDADQVAGTALTLPEPGAGYVDDLAVRDAWRGRGLGTALLVQTLRALHERGYSRAVLDVRFASGAIPLYERLGFATVHVVDYFQKPLAGTAAPPPGAADAVDSR